MSDYIRAFSKGGTFFFTVVTYQRHPIFDDDKNIYLLKKCFQTTIKAHPFRIDAIVVLPDHLHTIWTLPDDSDFSMRWRLIKGNFSRHYSGFSGNDISCSMIQKKERGVWQRRFWEHMVRDQADFNKHCDYIHYNPVKHGLVRAPVEWKHSSFKNFVTKGFYPSNWGSPIEKETAEMNYE